MKSSSVTNPSIWVKFIYKNSNKLAIEHSLLNSPIIIRYFGIYSRSTDLADKPHSKYFGHFVNKPQILFCDGPFLMFILVSQVFRKDIYAITEL